MSREMFLQVMVCFVLLVFTVPGSAEDNVVAQECLKGTVSKVMETSLSLSNTTFPDRSLGKQDVTVNLDKATKFFDGAKGIARDQLEPGNLVLVYCAGESKERKASLVRIIGGKKQ